MNSFLSNRLEMIRSSLDDSRRMLLLWKFLSEKAGDPGTNIHSAARHVGMRKDHLSATLRKRAGVTFGELLSLHRLEKAQRLIRDNKHSLTEICYLCGFNSPVTFWRHCKRRLGFTPSEWRRRRGQLREPKVSGHDFSVSKSRKLK